MKLELEHQKQISPLKENVSASISGGMSAVRIAKMPKLVISKFEGTSQDWVRFSIVFPNWKYQWTSHHKIFLPKGIDRCKSTETDRWITFHRRGLPQSQSSTREKIWPKKDMVASCKCCQQRLRSRWALFISSVLCHVNLLALTVF